MRFHGLMLTRDDADIIGQCIDHALTWCDAIHVYDTGSTDSTWEIVNSYAARDKRVIPWKHENCGIVLYSGLRGYFFHQFRDQIEDGDWVAQIDTDEFYHIPPPQFVREQLRRGETGVFHHLYEFRITQSELAKWDAGDRSGFDRSRPIAELRRRYNIIDWTEPRMFRYRRTMQWSPEMSYPWNMGYISDARIPIRHYPQRDPIQLQQRNAMRLLMRPLTENWSHWENKDWRVFIAADDAPDLFYWEPGKPLGDVLRKPVAKPYKRMAQWMAHRFLLPLLDRRRPAYPEDFRPRPIPPEIDAKIVAALRQIAADGGIRS
jgi:glycosyltransferase involved in cell wall biosynthesis